MSTNLVDLPDLVDHPVDPPDLVHHLVDLPDLVSHPISRHSLGHIVERSQPMQPYMDRRHRLHTQVCNEPGVTNNILKTNTGANTVARVK